MSIDRRSFIKLTAVSGGAAAIAACGPGNASNQLIRFIPDEDLTPGIAELKNGICPICRAGACAPRAGAQAFCTRGAWAG